MKIECLKGEDCIFGRLEYTCLLRRWTLWRGKVKGELVVIEEGGRR